MNGRERKSGMFLLAGVSSTRYVIIKTVTFTTMTVSLFRSFDHRSAVPPAPEHARMHARRRAALMRGSTQDDWGPPPAGHSTSPHNLKPARGQHEEGARHEVRHGHKIDKLGHHANVKGTPEPPWT